MNVDAVYSLHCVSVVHYEFLMLLLNMMNWIVLMLFREDAAVFCRLE